MEAGDSAELWTGHGLFASTLHLPYFELRKPLLNLQVAKNSCSYYFSNHASTMIQQPQKHGQMATTN